MSELFLPFTFSHIKVKGKAIPVQAWAGFQEVKVPRCPDNWHVKVVGL